MTFGADDEAQRPPCEGTDRLAVFGLDHQASKVTKMPIRVSRIPSMSGK
jgi:hypothetical protein